MHPDLRITLSLPVAREVFAPRQAGILLRGTFSFGSCPAGPAITAESKCSWWPCCCWRRWRRCGNCIAECQPSSPSLPGPGAGTNATAWRDALTSWRTKASRSPPNGQVFDAASFDTTYVQPFTSSGIVRCGTIPRNSGKSMHFSNRSQAAPILCSCGRISRAGHRRPAAVRTDRGLAWGTVKQKKLVEQVSRRPVSAQSPPPVCCRCCCCSCLTLFWTSPSASVVPRTMSRCCIRTTTGTRACVARRRACGASIRRSPTRS